MGCVCVAEGEFVCVVCVLGVVSVGCVCVECMCVVDGECVCGGGVCVCVCSRRCVCGTT